jgi:hypothetical protein
VLRVQDGAMFPDFSTGAKSGLNREKSSLIIFSSRLIYVPRFIFLGAARLRTDFRWARARAAQ